MEQVVWVEQLQPQLVLSNLLVVMVVQVQVQPQPVATVVAVLVVLPIMVVQAAETLTAVQVQVVAALTVASQVVMVVAVPMAVAMGRMDQVVVGHPAEVAQDYRVAMAAVAVAVADRMSASLRERVAQVVTALNGMLHMDQVVVAVVVVRVRLTQ
jgi:hypothetical protein